jgi:hypothetical protein
MSLRDRFFTPRTARAVLSGRILVGVGVAAAMVVAGVGWAVSIGVGVAVYAALVGAAMPRPARRAPIDPFTVGEPWRHLVQGAQRAAARAHASVEGATPGPLRDRLSDIVDRLDRGLEETWRIARRGDELDDAVRRLDPTGLRSRLESLRLREPSAEVDAAIESIEAQLETVDRLQERSARTADRLRLVRTRLDELAARAAEVSVGTDELAGYEHDVDDLVIELEALRQAVEETNRP